MPALPALPDIDADTPVLIAGPTASGKSALALDIAERFGGIIVNADAIQVYQNWRILTACPPDEDLARAPHALYRHVSRAGAYSVGHWLRDLEPILQGDQRPIITGGTGLYFSALTVGLAEIPMTPKHIREEADNISKTTGYEALLKFLDKKTISRIDCNNPMRVQRAWEVMQATGKSFSDWHDSTPPPRLPVQNSVAIVIDADKEWLNARIARRFDAMVDEGALAEVADNLSNWDPSLLSSKAIGANELISHLNGTISLEEACERATIATRQFAKRQRTWFRSKMDTWHKYRIG